MAVALEFIRGFRKHFGAAMTPAQQVESARWQRELETVLNQLAVAWANNLKAGVEAWASPPKRPQR